MGALVSHRPGAGRGAAAECLDAIGPLAQPRLRRGMALRHRTADKFDEHLVLAVEIEVERAARDAGDGQDLRDGKVAELTAGQQRGRGGKDGFAQLQVQRVVGGPIAAAVAPPTRIGRTRRPIQHTGIVPNYLSVQSV